MRTSGCSPAPASLYFAYAAMFIAVGVSQASFAGVGMAFFGLALAALIRGRRP